MSAVILSEEMYKVLLLAMKKTTKEQLLKEHKTNKLGWLYIPYHKLSDLTYEELEKALDGNYIIPKRGDYVTNKETKEVYQFGYINHRKKTLHTLDCGISKYNPKDFRLSTEEEIRRYAEEEIKSKVWRLKSSTHGYAPVESRVEFNGNEAILTVRMVKDQESEESKWINGILTK